MLNDPEAPKAQNRIKNKTTKMKRSIFITLLVLLTAAPSIAQKLGHVNRQELLLQLPERATAETKIQDFAKQLEGKLQAMQVEYQNELARLQTTGDSLTATEQQAAMRDLQELEQRIVDAQQKAQADMSKMEEELLTPMIERLDGAIAEVAEENNYAYVFDTSAGLVVYTGGGTDLQPLVKKKLSLP